MYGYQTAVYFVCGSGLAANLLLQYVIFSCPLRATAWSKPYFILTSCINILMAACFSLLVPRVIVHDQFFVFFAVGPASSWGAGARALILIHQATVKASVVYTTNSFLFRYVQLCRNQFFYLFFSPTPVLFVTTMNILLICNWVAMIYVTTWPRADFVDYADNYILENYGYMLTEASMGFRLDHMSPGAFAFLIEALILLLLLASLSTFCAVSINAYLKHNTISERARKVHRTMFLLLSFQTACPLCLLHAPLASYFVMVFTGMCSPSAVSTLAGILMSAYPLCSALFIMMFMKDYRRYLQNGLCFGRHKQMEISTVDGRSRTVIF